MSKVSKHVVDRLISLDSPSRELILNIDWMNTQMFPLFNVGGLKVNLKNMFRYGNVDYTSLKELVEDVYSRLKNEVYNGEKLFINFELNPNPESNIPDILIECNENFWFITSSDEDKVILFDFPKLTDDSRLDTYSTTVSNHIRDAFYVFSGKIFRKRDETVRYNIMDIAPLILYIHDIPIPTGIDGKFPVDSITKEVFNRRKPKTVSYISDLIKKRTGKIRRKIGKK